MIRDLLLGECSQEEVLRYYNANITYVSVPYHIKGFVYRYKGIYNIFINQSLSYEDKRNTIIHELAHIELNQLDQVYNDMFIYLVDKYEDEVDEYIGKLKEEILWT